MPRSTFDRNFRRLVVNGIDMVQHRVSQRMVTLHQLIGLTDDEVDELALPLPLPQRPYPSTSAFATPVASTSNSVDITIYRRAVNGIPSAAFKQRLKNRRKKTKLRRRSV